MCVKDTTTCWETFGHKQNSSLILVIFFPNLLLCRSHTHHLFVVTLHGYYGQPEPSLHFTSESFVMTCKYLLLGTKFFGSSGDALSMRGVKSKFLSYFLYKYYSEIVTIAFAFYVWEGRGYCSFQWVLGSL